MKNEIIIYQADSHSERIEVTLENETVWLSLNQILFSLQQHRVCAEQNNESIVLGLTIEVFH